MTGLLHRPKHVVTYCDTKELVTAKQQLCGLSHTLARFNATCSAKILKCWSWQLETLRKTLETDADDSLALGVGTGRLNKGLEEIKYSILGCDAV
jgi:hypothetical protein